MLYTGTRCYSVDQKTEVIGYWLLVVGFAGVVSEERLLGATMCYLEVN